jgi:hypothetical protein
MLNDVNDHPLQIAADIFSGNAQGLHPLLADPMVAPLIAVRVIAHVV